MYISKFELKGIRGVGPEGLVVDLSKPAIRARGTLAGWTVFAGPNGFGKTTLLQGLAASLVGTSGGRLLIGPDDNRWLARSATIGVTTSWVERVPEDDSPDATVETLKPIRFRVEWLRGGETRAIPPRGNPGFPHMQFWDAFNPAARPDGWIFAGYGPHRSVQRSSNDAYELIDKLKPRASAVVGLFRDDAALEKGYEWLKGLATGRLRDESAKATLLDGLLRVLGDRLLVPEHPTQLQVDDDGVLMLAASDGHPVPVSAMGDGFRMLVGMVLDILYQIERFKPGRLLEDVLTWLDAGEAEPVIGSSGVIVIDEPENHLHPALQQHIGFWLKKHFPKMQFIVCTHSALICQAADKGGLLCMPRPFEVKVVDEDTWEAVTNGTLDDAIMTELFGLSSPVAPEGRKLREELGDLESEMQRRNATPEELSRRAEILSMLPDSVDIRIAAALNRLANRR